MPRRLREGWRLTPSRGAVLGPTRAAVIADLHLGYTAARRASGDALPAQLPGPMLQRLRRLIRAHRIARLIVAGDLVERGSLGAAAAAQFVRQLADLNLELHLVSGNHDRGMGKVPGLAVHGPELVWAGARIVHFTAAAPADFTIMGHVHPVIRDRRRLGQAPCYLRLGDALVLPAQSDDAAGANVLAIKALQRAECVAIVEGRLLELGRVAALKKALQDAVPAPTSSGRRKAGMVISSPLSPLGHR
jgi:metallophosphoesterase superfamily enzyme